MVEVKQQVDEGREQSASEPGIIPQTGLDFIYVNLEQTVNLC